jgi:phenylacetate-CoA ligase
LIQTAFAQLRFAASLLLGYRFAPWSLDFLVAALCATEREFGSAGSEAVELLGGPSLDEQTRGEIALRRFRTQASRAARETTYYGQLFARLGLNPALLRPEDIATIPLTPKQALRADPDAFVRQTGRPHFRTTTTGSTGRPTSVAFSTDELRVYAALAALGLLLRREVVPEDVVQISTSSRALLGNLTFAGACAHLGALVSLTGLLEPTQALALLAEQRKLPGKRSRVSVLFVYPSYLGELVEKGLCLGYGPSDFGLERVFIGGEIVTAGLKARSQRLFGPVQFIEGYTMTETFPFTGSLCPRGHLHFEVSQGLLEVHNPDTGAPARPDEAGTIVATPFPPYRETTLLLRYDTEDVVRPVAGPVDCSLRGLPATSNILGKRRLAVRHAAGWTYPRDVLEALEVLESVPLPARCGFWAASDGVVVEVVVREPTPEVRRTVGLSLEERGVPLRDLRLVTDPSELLHPFPLRASLRESSFAGFDGVSPSGTGADAVVRVG